jgi:hypothetical protein
MSAGQQHERRPCPAHECREPGRAELRAAQVKLLEAGPAPAGQQLRARLAHRHGRQLQLLERGKAGKGGGAERVWAVEGNRGPLRV